MNKTDYENVKIYISWYLQVAVLLMEYERKLKINQNLEKIDWNVRAVELTVAIINGSIDEIASFKPALLLSSC